MKRAVTILALAVVVTGCSREREPAKQAQETVPQRETIPEPPLRKERRAIDPKSSEAAEELVRGFGRLLSAGRLDEAYMLLGPNAPRRSEFDRRFSGLTAIEVTSGKAGRQEGAAGSIYVSVPISLSGRDRGKPVRRNGKAILRRVNDVPGSTEAQRRWHIERIDWDD